MMVMSWHKLSFFLLSTFQYLQICNSFPPCSGSECLNDSLLLLPETSQASLAL